MSNDKSGMSNVRDKLRGAGFDVRRFRPWLDAEGKSWITVLRPDGLMGKAESPIPAKLTKEQWVAAETAMLRACKFRMPLVNWLMDHVEVEESAPQAGRPTFTLNALPLPFTHSDPLWDDGKDFDHFTIMCECAGRRVGEAVERTLLHGFEQHGMKVPGLLTCGNPLWFGKSVADAVKMLKARKFYGPYAVAGGRGGSDRRLAEALNLDQISPAGIVDTPALKEGELVIFQASPDVVRIVVGLDVTLMQWDDGWKVACILVPQVRGDHHGNFGVAIRRTTP